jgi:hypothetical protein
VLKSRARGERDFPNAAAAVNFEHKKTASVTSLAFSVHTAGSEVSWVNSVNSE